VSETDLNLITESWRVFLDPGDRCLYLLFKPVGKTAWQVCVVRPATLDTVRALWMAADQCLSAQEKDE